MGVSKKNVEEALDRLENRVVAMLGCRMDSLESELKHETALRFKLQFQLARGKEKKLEILHEIARHTENAYVTSKLEKGKVLYWVMLSKYGHNPFEDLKVEFEVKK